MIDDIDRETLEVIRRHADLENKVMLEIGCGDGRVSAMLAGKVSRLTAIDPDADCIASARSRISGVDFQVGRGEALPYKNASFDLVLFTLSLHHHRDMDLAIEEAYRVLRPGGRALVIEPLAEGEVSRLFNLIDDESPELERAQAAVESGPFIISGRESFRTKWVFDDLKELYDYLSEQFDQQLIRENKEGLKRILGDRADMRPIETSDDMVLISLIK